MSEKAKEYSDIDGYLLGDPSIDGHAIEQRMLEDPEFALQVAAAAEQLELIALAASSLPVPVGSSAAIPVSMNTPVGLLSTGVASQSTSDKRQNAWSSSASWTAVLVIAATLVIGIVTTLALRGSRRGFDEVATSWIAIEQEMASRGLSPIQTPYQDAAFEPEDAMLDPATETRELFASSSSDSEDWLIDGAIAFYSESGL